MTTQSPRFVARWDESLLGKSEMCENIKPFTQTRAPSLVEKFKRFTNKHGFTLKKKPSTQASTPCTHLPFTLSTYHPSWPLLSSFLHFLSDKLHQRGTLPPCWLHALFSWERKKLCKYPNYTRFTFESQTLIFMQCIFVATNSDSVAGC